MERGGEYRLDGRPALIVGDDEMAETIAARLREAGADAATTGTFARMGDEAAIGECVAAFERERGPIELLVHVWERVPECAAEDLEPAIWKETVQANVKSKFLFAKAAGRSMLARERGVIVFLSSIAGFVAVPGAVAYAASHGAVQQITRTLAVEWAGRGIRVNALAVPLPATASAGARVAAQTPLQGSAIAGSAEIADAFLYLAADASRSVTGQILTVDGGYTAK